MRILHLTLKKKWFDLIASGEKKEEYREIKKYWMQRLIDISKYPKESPYDKKYIFEDMLFDFENGHSFDKITSAYFSSIKEFDAVEFINGYSRNAPRILLKLEGIEINEGLLDFGAKAGKLYFVIKLGEVIHEK